MSGLEDARNKILLDQRNIDFKTLMLHFVFISPAVSDTFGIIFLLFALASAELACRQLCRELLFALTMVETDYTGPF